MNVELIITKFEEAVKKVLNGYDGVHARIVKTYGVNIEFFVKKDGERKWIGRIIYNPETVLLTVIKNEISATTLNDFTQTIEECAKELLHVIDPHRFNLIVESRMYKLTPIIFEAPIPKLDAEYLVKNVIDIAKSLGLKVVFSTEDLEKSIPDLGECYKIEEASYLILVKGKML
ncbi:MAG: hypothetical protein JHC31_16060 [Sulfurihydrogenibium sp.]|jgi:hypothetical protein|nr:hypothetical protein [Sulfurihydrogenibium sp.]